MKIFWLPLQMFALPKDTVKVHLCTNLHISRGYKGMKNCCLWTGHTECSVVLGYKFNPGAALTIDFFQLP